MACVSTNMIGENRLLITWRIPLVKKKVSKDKRVEVCVEVFIDWGRVVQMDQ